MSVIAVEPDLAIDSLAEAIEPTSPSLQDLFTVLVGNEGCTSHMVDPEVKE